MHGVGYIPNGLSLLYLRFVVYSRLLGGKCICAAACGFALGAPDGDWAVCLKELLLHIIPMGLSPCVYLRACGMPCDARVSPPRSALHVAAPWGSAWECT